MTPVVVVVDIVVVVVVLAMVFVLVIPDSSFWTPGSFFINISSLQ